MAKTFMGYSDCINSRKQSSSSFASHPKVNVKWSECCKPARNSINHWTFLIGWSIQSPENSTILPSAKSTYRLGFLPKPNFESQSPSQTARTTNLGCFRRVFEKGLPQTTRTCSTVLSWPSNEPLLVSSNISTTKRLTNCIFPNPSSPLSEQRLSLDVRDDTSL